MSKFSLVSLTALVAPTTLCWGWVVPDLKVVPNLRNKDTLFVDHNAAGERRGSVGLGYAPVSAAEELMLDDPSSRVRVHDQPVARSGYDLFAYPEETKPQMQQRQQPVKTESTRRYFKQDRRHYEEVLPGVYAEQEVSDLAVLPQEPKTLQQPESQDARRPMSNRAVEEALRQAKQQRYQMQQYQEQLLQQVQRQQQQQQQQQTFVEEMALWTDFGTRWGEVMPDMEQEDLALCVTANTMYCPKSISIYYDMKLFGWQEIQPDECLAEGGAIYMGYDREERKKKNLKAKEHEPASIMLGGASL